ncbi:dihydroorotate dehydrogenase electron transfer subunit [Candidatus Woesearchaeota archaeon]|nr:dihydroorotate dehydrogenase electron transfer subunit [Candidatus Woesearchaeota archaeon]
MTELPTIIKIKRIVDEAEDVKTFFFDYKIDFEPGQFFILWIPGLDEKPFAISHQNKEEIGMTIHKVGEFTKKLFLMKKGDKIGIRGPYGKGFSIKKSKSCVVGGGVGVAELSILINKLKDPVIINGARSKNNLVFLDRFKAHITTDDGSLGEKGFTTDVFSKLLETEKFDVVYTCGPEIMMKKIFEICEKHNIELQVSMERYMSCGFGVCGKCMCNDQIVCKDGPVFDSKKLRKMSEFGESARLRTGKKATLKEYYGK